MKVPKLIDVEAELNKIAVEEFAIGMGMIAIVLSAVFTLGAAILFF